MEMATLVADGAVSWISVGVEILDCPPPPPLHPVKHARDSPFYDCLVDPTVE